MHPAKGEQIVLFLEEKYFVFVCGGARIGAARLLRYDQRGDVKRAVIL